MSHRQKAYMEIIIVTAFGLMLYLPFRSIQWDLNGIAEARAIDSAGAVLISPNHMLYRPLGLGAFALARSVGYKGTSAEILQYITVIMAGVGLGLFFRWIKNLTDNVLAASIASVFLATSWAFWVFSTDAYYITPAATMVAGALVVLSSQSRLTHRAIIILALLVALAILFWQANVFLVPTMILGLVCKRHTNTLREALTNVGLFLTTACAIVGCAYLMAGLQIYHLSSIHDFTTWLLSHSSQGSIPLWGKWSADRVPSATSSALASFIPVWEGLGLRDALKGIYSWDKLLAQLSTVAFAYLCLVTCIAAIWNRGAVKSAYSKLVLLGLAYLAYVPFIIWWDPYDPKWFVIPNLFFVAILAEVWSVSFIERRRFVIMLGALILIIAAANFEYTIWPRHSRPNTNIQVAQCFAANATKKDTVLVLDWNWFDYTDYFFSYQGNSLSLIGNTTDKSRKVQLIRDSVVEANKQGGHVYLQDWHAYSADELALAESLTGLTPADLGVFEQQHAFSCHDSNFLEIAQGN